MVSNHLFYRFYRSARPLGRTEGTCFPVFYQIAMALCAVVNVALWPAIGSRLRTCPPRFAGYTKWVWSQLSTKFMAFCGKWAPQARRMEEERGAGRSSKLCLEPDVPGLHIHWARKSWALSKGPPSCPGAVVHYPQCPAWAGRKTPIASGSQIGCQTSGKTSYTRM